MPLGWGRLDPLASAGKEMSDPAARVADQPTNPSEVLVSRLSGGSPLKGTLSGLGNAGARVILDRPLDSGEVIRLTFPRKPGETRHRGRMIIGQVLHSRYESGHHIVGVAFGWSTGFKRKPSKRSASPFNHGLWSWLCDYFVKVKSRSPARCHQARSQQSYGAVPRSGDPSSASPMA